VGTGPIELGTIELVRISGAKVITMDVNYIRLNFCKRVSRLSEIINPAKENDLE
jgi:threonine dehydrogenase-like Zn-dependent dehydrogenase